MSDYEQPCPPGMDSQEFAYKKFLYREMLERESIRLNPRGIDLEQKFYTTLAEFYGSEEVRRWRDLHDIAFG